MWRRWPIPSLRHTLDGIRWARPRSLWRLRRRLGAYLALVLCAFVAGCPRLDMYDQPRYEAGEPSGLFDDGAASRLAPAGTVARGALRQDRVLHTGTLDDSTFASELPLALTREMLERGRERYGIFCAVCHDATGAGRGMVVRRGFKQPASFHEPRLRSEPVGYFFDVITNGFATMPGYAAQIGAHDRWAIVAYIRALQLSQNLDLNSLTVEARREIEAALAAGAQSGASEGEGHD